MIVGAKFIVTVVSFVYTLSPLVTEFGMVFVYKPYSNKQGVTYAYNDFDFIWLNWL